MHIRMINTRFQKISHNVLLDSEDNREAKGRAEDRPET